MIKLQALVERAKRAMDKQNDHVHTVWAQGFDSSDRILWSEGDGRCPQPTVEELRKLEDEIEEITMDLVSAKVDGFLAEALEKPQDR